MKPCHNHIIISLQYQKLQRKSNESSHEWKGRLQTKAADCEYKEYCRLLTEQFIGALNDEGMTDEIVREVATLGNIEEATSECILAWVCRLEVC